MEKSKRRNKLKGDKRRKKQTHIGGKRRNVNAGGEPNHLSLLSLSVFSLSLSCLKMASLILLSITST